MHNSRDYFISLSNLPHYVLEELEKVKTRYFLVSCSSLNWYSQTFVDFGGKRQSHLHEHRNKLWQFGKVSWQAGNSYSWKLSSSDVEYALALFVKRTLPPIMQHKVVPVSHRGKLATHHSGFILPSLSRWQNNLNWKHDKVKSPT